ncbi:SRPBCC family protein [Pseudoflavonifractor gallinarum]|uniref:SRPBCC family protein n=1 Tax=Pseudoflavonifractor gallinarum TaxID=2779352 RepID=UPI002E2CEFFF|nr:SRPBCC family protein [Pseudoflavonifractor gallinarum]
MPTSKVTVHFSCPVERVWQVVTDLSNTAWRSDLKRVEVLDRGPLRRTHQERLRHELHRHGL